jgi:hypothetical protein
MNDHGAAGEGGEGFTGESDGGVTRRNNGDDRHAIISGDSILASDLRQETASRAPDARRSGAAGRALLAIALLVAAAAGAAAVHRGIENRRHRHTGSAAWIWAARAGRMPRPLRFYAFREWDLAAAPKEARALVFADPEAVLRVNGARVASLRQRPGSPLASVDLAPHLRAGRNRVVFEASSEDGIGGLLFWAEGDGIDANAVASGSRWRVTLDAREAESGDGRPAIVWGKPPQSPWGYPDLPAAAAR